jgi:ABC-2 type transport system ATP-binding protein
VIVLDEPTAGVDVGLRQTLWQFIRRLNSDGHTIVLTTHYLEEAESLCGRIAMLKAGRIVALDSTTNLLSRYSGHRLRIKTSGRLPADLAPSQESDEGWYVFPLDDVGQIEPLLQRIRASGAHIDNIEIGKPDLEEVFVHLMQRQEH